MTYFLCCHYNLYYDAIIPPHDMPTPYDVKKKIPMTSLPFTIPSLFIYHPLYYDVTTHLL